MHQLLTQQERGKITLPPPKRAVVLDQRKPTQRAVYLRTLLRLGQLLAALLHFCEAQQLDHQKDQSLWSRMTPYTSYVPFFPAEITAW